MNIVKNLTIEISLLFFSKKWEVIGMPLEGHGMDCDCGCCDIETEPETKPQAKCVCPSCGKEMPSVAGTACAARKCPSCGADLQPPR